MPKLTRSAGRDLQRLPEPLRAKAKEIIGRLDAEPSLGKRLRGRLEGKRSARLGRSHRIIYTSTPGKIVIMAVKQRKDAYR
ncbi:MAG: type II toxin-antitoxin system RelE/ParE family toxin [Acidimicrobiaceae bacterium]|nr:type II toxin-antitoxin system RelE/ParE family toxin [Acidimicrobiaceae bacterium]